VRLPVRTREIVTAGGSRVRALEVFCPARRQSIQAAVCGACEHASACSSSEVVCDPPGITSALDLDPEADAGAAANATTTCARSDVVGATLVGMIPELPRGVPVVDDIGRFVGFVSSAHLAKSPFPWRVTMAMAAGDLAFGSSLSVHETAPLSSALRVMARHAVREVALVDGAGGLHGVLTDLGALRALVGAGRIAR